MSEAAPAIVCFDVGETLIDETRLWAVWADVLGVSALTMGAVLGAAIVQGEPHEMALAHVAPNVDWRLLVDEHEQRLGGLQRADLYPDAAACLARLREAGFAVAIAGNQPGRRRAQLERIELPHDHLLLSEELGHAKPDQQFFDGLLAGIGAQRPDTVLYVGDRVDNDVLPALRHGLAVCWLQRGPWGLLQDVPDGAEPDLVLEGLGELPELLVAWRDG